MSIDGTWNAVTKSPFGDQKAIMTITSEGDSFTGTSKADMTGESPIENGKIEGDAVTWTINMTKPMPMTVEGKATLSGDTLDGSVKAGSFGTWPFVATRG